MASSPQQRNWVQAVTAAARRCARAMFLLCSFAWTAEGSTMRRRYTPVRRWQPLTDAEWDALLPFVLVQDRPGRPLRDARARMDAILRVAASGSAWHTVPPRFGKPDTVSRHFRRLAHAGLWERLLRALARPDPPLALLAIEHWVVRACRRATRLRGLRIIVLARRLGLLSALRAPPWLLPDPSSS